MNWDAGRERDERTLSGHPTRRQVVGSLGAFATGAATVGRVGATGGFSTEDLTVESYDGTELAATLYDPGDGPNPVVLMTHGWGASRKSPLTTVKARSYAENGYAVLTYDSRGFGESGGVVGLDGPREVRDARRLITWLANRPEVATVDADDPMVGVDGLSYAGGIQFQVAQVDDRVDAIVPRITWNDLSYSFAPHGVVKGTWMAVLLGAGVLNTTDGDERSRVTPKLYEWYRKAVRNNELPPEAEQAFRERSIAHGSVDVPTFLVHGWDDTLFKPTEAVRTYRQLRASGVETAIAFYEGSHAIEELTVPGEERAYVNERTVDWMDRHVRGEPRSIEPVHAYRKQQGRFHTHEEWPPADVASTTYHLADANALGEDTIGESSLGWWFDDSAVTYVWPVQEDLEVVGTPEFELAFDVEGPEARVFCNLRHDGAPINGVGEAYRLSGAGTHEVTFEYPTLQRQFQAGDTLELRIGVTSPLYLESRRNDSVTVLDGASRIHLPRRRPV